MPQIILDLTAEKAKEFFLKGENYCTIELPIYFKFDSLLGEIDNKYSTNDQIYKKNTKNKDIYPSDYEDVNYKLFNNKDGKYAWRLLQLIHPVLYVKLVNDITKDWDTIKLPRYYTNRDWQAQDSRICLPSEMVRSGHN